MNREYQARESGGRFEKTIRTQSAQPGRDPCAPPPELTYALRREAPFHLARLLLLDIVRIHGQHLLAGPQQEKRKKHRG